MKGAAAPTFAELHAAFPQVYSFAEVSPGCFGVHIGPYYVQIIVQEATHYVAPLILWVYDSGDCRDGEALLPIMTGTDGVGMIREAFHRLLAESKQTIATHTAWVKMLTKLLEGHVTTNG